MRALWDGFPLLIGGSEIRIGPRAWGGFPAAGEWTERATGGEWVTGAASGDWTPGSDAIGGWNG